ncbi:DUF2560 family protein [Arsenophonus endosymbiont of Crataerina pallida]|uniref:DUF2560 family protein n=1 Tax=Arsenophonus endosymbiont of Crataerina pallida TaxID=3066235 RepID=UPI003BAF7C76
MKEITEEQQMRLDILRLVLLDTAAAQITIDFVKDESLNLRYFEIYGMSPVQKVPLSPVRKSQSKKGKRLYSFSSKPGE